MEKSRQLYIDNLRLWLIILVVMIHVAVTYSGIGDWYYVEPAELGIMQTVLFGFNELFTQGYFMGLLFLLAGYFIPESYDKKGFSQFIKDRVIRLGIPTLIYMLIIHPIALFGLLGYRIGGSSLLVTYQLYIFDFHFISGSGPLWFAFALLVFSICYALFRKLAKQNQTQRDKGFPAFPKILVLILRISVCAFLIRNVQPIGTNIMNMQLCFFSQYVILFIVGIKSKRNGWFEKLPYATGRRWLICGIIFGYALLAVIMVLGGGLTGNIDLIFGGFTWQSAAYSLWESFVGVAMSIGLIALFKEKFNKQNRLVKKMSANAFSVYVFHSVIIISLSLLFASVSLLPIIKFSIVATIGIPISFLLTDFTIQRVAFLRKLFA